MWPVGRKQKVSDVMYLGETDVAKLVVVFRSHCQLDNLMLLHVNNKCADLRMYASGQSVGCAGKSALLMFALCKVLVTCQFSRFWFSSDSSKAGCS